MTDDAPAKRPKPERAEWRKLWDEVDAILKRVGRP